MRTTKTRLAVGVASVAIVTGLGTPAFAACTVDGSTVTYCNVAEAEAERALSMHDVRVHVLSSGDGFDFGNRRPISPRR